jgi:hypothetical protein
MALTLSVGLLDLRYSFAARGASIPKVRAFVKKCQVDGAACRYEGRIDAGSYALDLGLTAHRLRAIIGRDEYGPFAIIREQRQLLADGYILEVEREYHEPDGIFDEPPGCVIRVFLPETRIQISDELLKRANVLIPPEKVASVTFNFAGRVEGWAFDQSALADMRGQ